MKETYIKLESVGSVIDTETLDTYPMDTEGNPIVSEEERFSLHDIDDEWFNRLNDVDFSTVSELLNTLV
jgi:hypothetical protein